MLPASPPNDVSSSPPALTRIEEFDVFVDEQWGTSSTDGFPAYEIAGERLRPSDILAYFKPEAYNTAYLEWLDIEGESETKPRAVSTPVKIGRETLVQNVFLQFPSPIAGSMWRFEKAWQNQNQRLGLMRDVWESLIFVIYSLVVSEWGAQGLPLEGAWMKPERLWSDKVGTRLEVLQFLKEKVAPVTQNQLLTLARLDLDLIGILQNLQNARNDFSHSVQRTEAQAKATIARHAANLDTVLEKSLWLRDVKIVLYVGSDGSLMRHRGEFFVGNPNINATEPFEIETSQLAEAAQFFHADKILVMLENRFWNGAPFLHFRQSSTDPCARLCFLKSADRSDNLKFGLAAELEDHVLPRADFQTEIDLWVTKAAAL